MAASLPVRTSIIILGFIAGLYTFITVLLLVCTCYLCYKKRKARLVSPKDYLSPPTSDNELEPGSSATSSRRTSTTEISVNSAQQAQLPNRYRRQKGKRKAAQTATACPEFEGARNSPVLKHGDAWSGDNSKSHNPLDSYSHSSKPATPDSGLAPSLKESKEYHGGLFPNESARSETPSSVQSSGKGSNSTAGDHDNEDVFDEKMTEAQTSMSRSFEETKKEVRQRPPKAGRTESTTPLMDDDKNSGLCTPSSDMEFDLKAILPPIKERKTESPDSLEGSFFANKLALERQDCDSPSYTELKDQPFRRGTPLTSLKDYVASPVSNKSGSLPRAGLLPPLFPPGHSQENLSVNKNEQTSAL